jgi:hypothetical protein
VSSIKDFKERLGYFFILLAKGFDLKSSSTLAGIGDTAGRKYFKAVSKVIAQGCKCGRPLIHQGLCSERLRYSPSLQEHLKRLNRLNRAKGLKDKILLVVDKAIPKNLPYDVKEDVRQELLVGALHGDFDVRDIKQVVPLYTRKINNLSANKFAHVFLDHPAPGFESGKLMRDVIGI